MKVFALATTFSLVLDIGSGETIGDNIIHHLFHRDIAAAVGHQLLIQEPHRSPRHLQAATPKGLEEHRTLQNLSDECVNGIATIFDDPAYAAALQAYDMAYIESVSEPLDAANDCEEMAGGTTLLCTLGFDLSAPEADVTAACEALGGTSKFYEGDLLCVSDGFYVILDWPGIYNCVPPECVDEVDPKTEETGSEVAELWGQVLQADCVVGDGDDFTASATKGSLESFFVEDSEEEDEGSSSGVLSRGMAALVLLVPPTILSLLMQ